MCRLTEQLSGHYDDEDRAVVVDEVAEEHVAEERAETTDEQRDGRGHYPESR